MIGRMADRPETPIGILKIAVAADYAYDNLLPHQGAGIERSGVSRDSRKTAIAFAGQPAYTELQGGESQTGPMPTEKFIGRLLYRPAQPDIVIERKIAGREYFLLGRCNDPGIEPRVAGSFRPCGGQEHDIVAGAHLFIELLGDHIDAASDGDHFFRIIEIDLHIIFRLSVYDDVH